MILTWKYWICLVVSVSAMVYVLPYLLIDAGAWNEYAAYIADLHRLGAAISLCVLVPSVAYEIYLRAKQP